jgi:hypothetical protein
MKIGSLVRVRHFSTSYNGMIGILISIRKHRMGLVDCYSVVFQAITTR